jgi:hypothetical protein
LAVVNIENAGIHKHGDGDIKYRSTVAFNFSVYLGSLVIFYSLFCEELIPQNVVKQKAETDV